jgi:hypothetical protein
MDNKSTYILVESTVLPEIYSKVLEVKRILEKGDAKTINEAVKMIGISRRNIRSIGQSYCLGHPSEHTFMVFHQLAVFIFRKISFFQYFYGILRKTHHSHLVLEF